MMRWYSVSLWQTLRSLGYQYIMRMDDDSVVHSTVSDNLFDRMRDGGRVYGWRQYAPFTARVCKELKMLRNHTPELHHSQVWDDYCKQHTILGFYNNWFISGVDWWLTKPVVALQRGFEDSRLVFTRRLNDLVFQSIVVLTLLPPKRRVHFLDFSYEHATIKNGTVTVGGFESGYNDPKGHAKASAFKRRYQKGIVKVCEDVETSDADAPRRKTFYWAINHCPVCETNFWDSSDVGQQPREQAMVLASEHLRRQHGVRAIALPALLNSSVRMTRTRERASHETNGRRRERGARSQK